MTYPQLAFTEKDVGRMLKVMRARPFAHLFTGGETGPLVTRLPFVTDIEEGKILRLRSHMSMQNPQVGDLGGQQALIAFSGPDSFVSPNWRTDKSRGATWDYTAVHIWGDIVLRPEREFFETLVNDLASEAEAHFSGISDEKFWRIKDAPKPYVDRLFPKLVAFEIIVTRILGISKLHQNFPDADALSVADHLDRADNSGSREIGILIRDRLPLD